MRSRKSIHMLDIRCHGCVRVRRSESNASCFVSISRSRFSGILLCVTSGFAARSIRSSRQGSLDWTVGNSRCGPCYEFSCVCQIIANTLSLTHTQNDPKNATGWTIGTNQTVAPTSGNSRNHFGTPVPHSSCPMQQVDASRQYATGRARVHNTVTSNHGGKAKTTD
jgi:hypothetical protein